MRGLARNWNIVQYTINSRDIHASFYDEDVSPFHRENFNHPLPVSWERDNSWATSWSRLVKAELISRCNDVPAKLHHELKREPTKDEIKAARDALYQESRTAAFVPESFGIHDPRDWMHGIAHGIKFDFTAEHEYERDENGRIKTKGAKKRKVIVPGKSTYHFGFTIPLIENGKKTGTVVARPTFDEAMEVAMAQEYKLEKHAEPVPYRCTKASEGCQSFYRSHAQARTLGTGSNIAPRGDGTCID